VFSGDFKFDSLRPPISLSGGSESFPANCCEFHFPFFTSRRCAAGGGKEGNGESSLAIKLIHLPDKLARGSRMKILRQSLKRL